MRQKHERERRGHIDIVVPDGHSAEKVSLEYLSRSGTHVRIARFVDASPKAPFPQRWSVAKRALQLICANGLSPI